MDATPPSMGLTWRVVAALCTVNALALAVFATCTAGCEAFVDVVESAEIGAEASWRRHVR
jgi:hypothetical protein